MEGARSRADACSDSRYRHCAAARTDPGTDEDATPSNANEVSRRNPVASLPGASFSVYSASHAIEERDGQRASRVGHLLGADPLAVLRGGLLGQVLLLVGSGLLFAGLLWSDRIATGPVSR